MYVLLNVRVICRPEYPGVDAGVCEIEADDDEEEEDRRANEEEFVTRRSEIDEEKSFHLHLFF